MVAVWVFISYSLYLVHELVLHAWIVHAHLIYHVWLLGLELVTDRALLREVGAG